MAIRISDIDITKIGDDDYAVEIPDLNVNEESVNGSQLLGMLAGKRLIHTTKETALRTLDQFPVGHKITLVFEHGM